MTHDASATESNINKDAVKQILWDAFFGHFLPMCEQVKKLPIDPVVMQHILFKFNDGMLYVKDQIIAIDFDKPMPPQSAPSAPPIADPVVPVEATQQAA